MRHHAKADPVFRVASRLAHVKDVRAYLTVHPTSMKRACQRALLINDLRSSVIPIFLWKVRFLERFSMLCEKMKTIHLFLILDF